jgi:hypothetical protein
MKNLTLVIITLCMTAAALMAPVMRKQSAKSSPPTGRSPFQSIAMRDGEIVATLPKFPVWLIDEGTAEPRLTKPFECFTMRPGTVIGFHEHHASFRATAHLTPVAGLMIESTFSATSFGGGITRKKYFIAAESTHR